ncbi:hypothetical protein BJX76DRAFT_356598 [Aspergillus varians]
MSAACIPTPPPTQIIPIDESNFALLSQLFNSGGYFTEIEKVAIAALFCQRTEHLEWFINYILLPSCEDRRLDYEAMWLLKDYDPKFAVRSAHAQLDASSYARFNATEYIRQTASAQKDLPSQDDRWAWCAALHDDMRWKLLNTAGYGLKAVVPERLDWITQECGELQKVVSGRESVNHMLERAANVEWIMMDAQRVWTYHSESQAAVSGSSRGWRMTVEQAQELLGNRLVEWEAYIWDCENAR